MANTARARVPSAASQAPLTWPAAVAGRVSGVGCGGVQGAVQAQGPAVRGGQDGAPLVVSDLDGPRRGRENGARAGTGDLVVGGVDEALGLGPDAALDQREELGVQHRVVTAGVGPAGAPRTPGSSYRSVLAKIGRRLDAEHPQVTEPSQWTRQTCASWAAAAFP
ncbi:hypothetical protein AB0945_04430 [Streptomyces sp. NPDC005474]|uniref:hypothetical protein n=1 Tax=Streptomyces sp. NPDC005474 TaxID=3154878 RepID=UPI003455BB15